jgi:hypothetical protein
MDAEKIKYLVRTYPQEGSAVIRSTTTPGCGRLRKPLHSTPTSADLFRASHSGIGNGPDGKVHGYLLVAGAHLISPIVTIERYHR